LLAGRDHRQADPVASDGGADVDPRHGIARGYARAQVAGLVERQHLAHVGDDAGEHRGPPLSSCLPPAAPRRKGARGRCHSPAKAMRYGAIMRDKPRAARHKGRRGRRRVKDIEGHRRTARRVLLLQGPHGPFFRQLGAMLRTAGAEVWRVGFNRGDEVFWGREGYLPYTGRPEDWPAACADHLDRLAITDLVLYGDARAIHAEAIRAAKARGITVHVFEEGYLRPYWATYERGGSNGHSRLMGLSVAEMRAALARSEMEMPKAPAHWGDMRQHIFYGALYHFLVLALNRRYPGFRPHRGVTVTEEFRLYLRRLLLMPVHRLKRRLATWRIRRGAFPYHLVLLQLEHDASFRTHSDFGSMTEFITLCLEGFAAGAAPHHHLV